MTSVKPLKRDNQRSYLYKKRETRNTYEPHQQTIATEQQVPDLGQLQKKCSGFKRFNSCQPSP